MREVIVTMKVVYDENDGNAVHDIEHAMFNIESIVEWETEVILDVEIEEYDDEEDEE